MRHAVLIAAFLIAACAAPERGARVEEPPPAPLAASASVAAAPPNAPASTPPPADAGVKAPDACEAKMGSTHSAVNAPVEVEGRTLTPAQIKAALMAAYRDSPLPGGLNLCSYQVHGHDPGHIYVWALCERVVAEGARVVMKSAMSVPSVVDIDANGGISGVRRPGDGSDYGRDMKVLFPAAVLGKMTYAHQDLERALHAEAACRLGAPAP